MVAVAAVFTMIEALTSAEHPLASVTVYVIVAFPAATPVTTPLASTVATAASLVDQTPPVVALAIVVVAPSQTIVLPVIAATTGVGFTVTTTAEDVEEHPEAFVTVT
jgi:hypothetical protein